MNFHLPFKHSFHVEERCSNKQLAMDFEEFPPYPLNCKRSDSVVRIIRASGLGEVVNCFQISRKLFYVSSADSGARVSCSIRSEKVGQDGMEIVDIINDANRHVPTLFRSLTARIFRSVLVTWYSFVLLRIIRRRENGLGLFFPTDQMSGQITLTRDLSLLKSREEAILSHEHLHFLQHRDGEDHSKIMMNLSALIPEKDHGNGTLLYILQKREVEARLHEIVLNFYRAKKCLPISTEGFVELLWTSQCFREDVMEPLLLQGFSLGGGLEILPEREAMFPSQLANAFAYMTDSQCQYRFVTEVLAVMYGNLLRYYGDEVASLRYLAHISRPNLYDTLYGLDEIDSDHSERRVPQPSRRQDLAEATSNRTLSEANAPEVRRGTGRA